MTMKATHSADTNGITGSTRSHIISRLHKASRTINELIAALGDEPSSGTNEQDVLEAYAYAATLSGAEEFEKQNWDLCVKDYSASWVIYNALAPSSKSDLVKDLLSGTIEPSIRYGAYQMKLPRTVSVPTIAKKYFPSSDSKLVILVQKLDSSILKDTSKVKAETSEAEAPLRTITWRTRTVNLEDATIEAALSTVDTAARKLSDALATTSNDHPKERAAAYDDILISSQDAVDATKHAIDELTAEGVGQGDERMQSLQITRTAVSYNMISWRIGRNRVLTGTDDGALLDGAPVYNPRHTKKNKASPTAPEEGTGRRLARLREKVVMYDSTLQSFESIRELPGVAADTAFIKELDAKYSYFRALKCLAIARSYSIISEYTKALALLARASDLLSQAIPTLTTSTDDSSSSPPNSTISAESANSLSTILNGELQRHRALVELSDLVKKPDTTSTSAIPLIECLSVYPKVGVDLNNIVSYPPKPEPIPVKPLFFDVAWNYIDYPGRTPALASLKESVGATTEKASESAPSQKKGWFGFGR